MTRELVFNGTKSNEGPRKKATRTTATYGKANMPNGVIRVPAVRISSPDRIATWIIRADNMMKSIEGVSKNDAY